MADQSVAAHHFEDGALFAVAADGKRTEVARVDVSTIDALLLSVARIRGILLSTATTVAVAVMLFFGLTGMRTIARSHHVVVHARRRMEDLGDSWRGDRD